MGAHGGDGVVEVVGAFEVEDVGCLFSVRLGLRFIYGKGCWDGVGCAYPEILVPWQIYDGAVWHGWTLECPGSVEAGSCCGVDAICDMC